MAEENGHVSPVEDARDHHAATSRPAVDARTSKPYPLNSRRLTSPYLMCISRALGLPTNGAVEETRLMIEGRLTEMGREPRNVQVIVSVDTDGVEAVSLQDGSGMFVMAGCPLNEASGSGAGGGASGGEEDRPETVSGNRESEDERSEHDDSSLAGELAETRAHNEELTARNEELSQDVSSLREEVSKLREQLGRETERAGEMWKANCAQVAAFDETITAKDVEIERLLARVAALEASKGVVGATTPSTTHAPTVPLMHTSVVASPTVHVTHPTVSHLSPHLSPHPSHEGAVLGSVHVPRTVPIRRGKAPPVSTFTGEDPDLTSGCLH